MHGTTGQAASASSNPRWLHWLPFTGYELLQEDLVVANVSAEPRAGITSRPVTDNLCDRVSSSLHLLPVTIIGTSGQFGESGQHRFGLLKASQFIAGWETSFSSPQTPHQSVVATKVLHHQTHALILSACLKQLPPFQPRCNVIFPATIRDQDAISAVGSRLPLACKPCSLISMGAGTRC